MQRPQIDYAPALPSHKRRRLARRIAFGIVAATVVTLAINSGPSAWRHIEILYWQQQAMNYSAPAGKVVYDDDPSDAARIRASDPSLMTGRHGEVFDFAKPWDRFYQLASPPGRRPGATLFLHERTNQKGERRLVVVELRPDMFKNPLRNSDEAAFHSIIFSPGGFFHSPTELSPLGYHGWSGAGTVDAGTKWLMGQPDPGDPSHFTIRGVRNGLPLKIDGWLRDDHVDLDLPE